MSDSHPPASADSPNIDRPRDHAFDGIVEYDNDLPRWWLAMFHLSVVCAVIYVLHYHWGPGLLGPTRLRAEEAVIIASRPPEAGPLGEDDLRKLSVLPERIAKGKELFGKSNCITCHGPEATGLIGPNLRDKYWIWGSKMTEIVTTITGGRLPLMPPKGGVSLSSDDINNLAIFIVSLNRAGEKPGKPIDPAREKENPITY